MMRKFRLTALTLALALILAAFAFASCADDTDSPAETTAAPGPGVSQTGGEDTEPEETVPSFPEANYNNETFTVISRSPSASSYPAFYIGTEEPTDVMSSAVYTRNINTESKYGIVIEQMVSDEGNGIKFTFFGIS